MLCDALWRAARLGVLGFAVALSQCGGGGGASSTPPPATEPVAPRVPTALAVVADDEARVDVPLWFKTDLGAGTGLTYRWDFGDGTSQSTAAPSHTYAAEGAFTVNVTVTDGAGGRISATRQIQVRRGETPAAAQCTGPAESGWCLLPQRPRPERQALAFSSALDGVALSSVVAPGQLPVTTLRHTHDGGKTWSVGPTPPSTPLSVVDHIRFATADVGYVLSLSGAGRGMRTADAGRTWQEFALPLVMPGNPFGGGLRQFFTQGGSALLLTLDYRLRGLGGTISSFVSVNGGRDWSATRVSQGRAQSRNAIFDCVDGVVTRFDSLADTGTTVAAPYPCLGGMNSDGAAAVWFFSTDGVPVLSQDEGRSWSPTATGAGAVVYEGARFYGAGKGWAIAYTRTAGGAIVNTALVRTVDGGATWREVPGPAGVSAVPSPVGGDTAWVSSGATMHITRDGGATWRAVALPGASLSQGLSLDASGGLLMSLVSSRGATSYLRSQDGGLTWRVVHDEPERLLEGAAVWMRDAQRGLALQAPGRLLETRDGGASWQARHYAVVPYASDSYATALVGAPDGSVWSLDQGLMHASRDGGATWQVQSLPDGLSGRLTALQWVSASEGWALAMDCGAPRVANGNCQRTLWQTHDEGGSWRSLPAAGNDISLMVAAMPGAATVVRGDGGVWRSTDGGASWSRARTPTASIGPSGASKLMFANADRGWMLSVQGMLWRTVDGGASWQAVALPVPPDPSGQRSQTAGVIYGLAFANAMQGWATGVQGLVLRTDDGGQTWVQQNTGLTETLWAVHALDGNSAFVPVSTGLLRTSTAGR